MVNKLELNNTYLIHILVILCPFKLKHVKEKHITVGSVDSIIIEPNLCKQINYQ